MCDHSSHSCHYATIKPSLKHTNEKPNENDQMNKVVGRKSVYVKFSSIKFAFVLMTPLYYVYEHVVPSLEGDVCSVVAVCAPLTPILSKMNFAGLSHCFVCSACSSMYTSVFMPKLKTECL